METAERSKSRADYERLALQSLIDRGHYSSEPASRYFYNCPPYQYTSLEPKNWGKNFIRKEIKDED